MAISIYKVLKWHLDPNFTDGSMLVYFVLDNGVEKRWNYRGGLPNNNSQARADILEYGEELFYTGKIWSEEKGNIECSMKYFLDNIPDWTTIKNAIDVNFTDSGQNQIITKMAKGLLALLELGRD